MINLDVINYYIIFDIQLKYINIYYNFYNIEFFLRFDRVRLIYNYLRYNLIKRKITINELNRLNII